MKVYVKKLCSLNPDKYKFIELEQAQNLYYQWCNHTEKKGYIYPITKSFNEWLKTEI